MSLRSGVFIKYVVTFDITGNTTVGALRTFAGAATAGVVGAAAVAAPTAAGAAATGAAGTQTAVAAGVAAGIGATGGAIAGALGATPPSAKLKVSNDLREGDVCIDADISVKMSRWLPGTTFEIKLYDLPEPMVESLKATLKPKAKPRVTISLGYFDTKAAKVLDGVYEKIKSSVSGDRLVTTITGRESALFDCATTSYTGSLADKVEGYGEVAKKVLSKSNLKLDLVEKNPLPRTPVANKTFNGKTVLLVLHELAKEAQAELLISDNKIFLGSPILNDSDAVPEINQATNLAKFEPLKLKIPGTSSLYSVEAVSDKEVKGFSFTVTGDPALRPAQKIVVKGIKDYNPDANPEFRIRQVEHQFSTSTGYACVGAATERAADGKAAREIDAAIEYNAASAAADITDKIGFQATQNPVIEVASVKTAAAAYRTDLYYGQPAQASETQPSINVAIKQQDDHLYEGKPIISAFAWRKCGLITPVYPGMKAVVAHNRALSSDGMVAGYIWSKQPDFPPPENHAGDWWLCLPIDFDAKQPPGDSTKAVNDITANNGCRVIELKGLKIAVGAAGLKEIGKRPNPEDAKVADVCTIAHASGAVVTVQDGEIDVDTGAGPKLTLSSSGITLTDGKLNVQIANGKLAIG